MLIDAFATQRFTGNPAVVVLVPEPLPESALQNLAMEFNQAETAFLTRLAEAEYGLRWFTPEREVELCGHATLAAAQALREWGRIRAGQTVRFQTRWHGELRCRCDEHGVVMDLPVTRPIPAACPQDIHAALGLSRSVAITCVGSAGMNLTFRLHDESAVIEARPRLDLIAAYHPIGITITAPSAEDGIDFVSRFFAPNAGIPEDPVTGSAHCSLAPYWAGVLGKTTFVARQRSRRGGRLTVSLRQDRVELAGLALVTARGHVEGW